MMKKLKIHSGMIMRLFAITAFYSLLLSACVKEKEITSLDKNDIRWPDPNARIEVPLAFDFSGKVSTRADEFPGTSLLSIKGPKDGIKDITVIVFRNENGEMVFNDQPYVVNDFDNTSLEWVVNNRYTYKADEDYNNYPLGENSLTKSKTIILTPGQYDFFVGVNLQGTYGVSLQHVKSISDLNELHITKLTQLGNENMAEIIHEPTRNPFPRMQWLPGVLVSNQADPATPIKVNSSSPWTKALPVRVDRITSKINIALKKQTGITGTDSHEKDQILVKSIRLMNIPAHAYMLSNTYTGGGDGFDFYTLSWYKGPDNDNEYEENDWLIENDVVVPSNRMDVIVPEYILANLTEEELRKQAIQLEIQGLYRKYEYTDGEGDHFSDLSDVRGVVALKPEGSYNFIRNKHYNVTLTIQQLPLYEFKPEVTYEVLDWNDVGNGKINFGEPVNCDAVWLPAKTGNEVIIASGEAAECAVTFSRANDNESKIKWGASLTNPTDFMFEPGSISGGYALPGTGYPIRIVPRNPNNAKQKSTGFVIRVDRGRGTIDTFEEITIKTSIE